MSQFLNTTDIVQSVNRWKKHLVIIAAIAAVASAIFSGPSFIPERYKSYAILYPSNLIAYSNESASEQMLQLMQSTDIRKKVIDNFHLKEHYDIDTVNNTHQMTDVIRAYEENVTIKATEYESVEITVYDESPQVASDMVDSIITYFNQKTRELQRAKAAEVVVIFRNLFEAKKQELDSLDNKLREFRTRSGLLDYDTQVKEYSRAYLRSQGGSGSRNMLDTLAERGGEFNALAEKMDNGLVAYGKIQLEYENALKDVSKELTYSNTVTKPIPADKKSYPIRWLIVLVSVASAVFVSFLVLLFMESSRPKGARA